MSRLFYHFPFYPLLIGIYPVLYLWAANYAQTPAFVIVRPMLVSLGLTTITWLGCEIAFRNLHKASVAAGVALIFFFFYGHIYDLITGWKVFGVPISRTAILLGAGGLIFVITLVWLIRTRSSLHDLTQVLNLTVAFLLIMILGQLAFFFVTNQIAENSASIVANAGQQSQTMAAIPNDDTPDVYYILMDGYDREDLLRQDIGLDNHEFIAQLEQLGFVVPDCTQSNYNTTIFAVASTFNMNYLDQLGFSYESLIAAEGGDEIATPELVATIHSNPVMRLFQNMGYQIITLQNSYPFLEFPNADIVYGNETEVESRIETVKFEYLFAQTTLLQRVIIEVIQEPEKFRDLPGWMLEFISPDFKLYQKYQQDLYQLNQLDQITQVPGKKFLYAHLLTTHPDFAFTLSGEQRAYAEETKPVYAEQVVYTNQRILQVVKTILTQSKTPPIIILQGDHGYGYGGRGVEQFKILNAYYLPDGGKEKLYPEITPVNTFRLILSEYFGMNYPFLPDQSIWIHEKFAAGYELEAGTCVN
jgi:hypothetical protein